MKRLLTIFTALVVLVFVAQPADAGLKVIFAKIAGGEVQVCGIGAGKKQPIYWEGNPIKVTTSDWFGKFHFSTTVLPIDCVGELQSGSIQSKPIEVVINGCCTTEEVVYEAGVPQTGQTTCYDSSGGLIDCAGPGKGQDGYWAQYVGVPWPNPRFTDNLNGTVTDNLTKLIWLKNANCPNGATTWQGALDFVAGINSSECGLTDGSAAGDWRLPNVRELQSLVDYGQVNPALPSGHGTFFDNFRASFYWSSSTDAGGTSDAWIVDFGFGGVFSDDKTFGCYVHAVRGGP